MKNLELRGTIARAHARLGRDGLKYHDIEIIADDLAGAASIMRRADRQDVRDASAKIAWAVVVLDDEKRRSSRFDDARAWIFQAMNMLGIRRLDPTMEAE